MRCFCGPRHGRPQSDDTLESFSFYSSLYSYSRPKLSASEDPEEEDDLDQEPPLGVDGDLVPEIISKAVAPRLAKLFEAGAYDPYSGRETRKAVDLLEHVEELLGQEKKGFQVSLQMGRDLVKVVSDRFDISC